jgi:HAD superfamily hydrolase (TIGR01490 family)
MDKPVIAAFDFDGTITTNDILLPFLIFFRGKKTVYLSIVKMLPALILFLLGRRSRQDLKEHLLHSLIGHMPMTLIESMAEQFHEKQLPRLIRKDAQKRLEWHRREGHQVVIVSANLSLLLHRFAKDQKASLLSSELEIDPRGKITGRLQGLNCWGPEKAHRLIEKYGVKENFVLYAYGDSRGDQELLALADYPHYRYFSK